MSNELKQKLHSKIFSVQKHAQTVLEKSKDVQIGGRSAYKYVPIVDMVKAILGTVEISVISSVEKVTVDWQEKSARVVIEGTTIVTDLETGYSENWRSVGMSAANGDKAIDIATTFMKRNALKQIFHAHGVDDLEEYNEGEPQKTVKKQKTSPKWEIDLNAIKSVQELRAAFLATGMPFDIMKEALKKLKVEKLDDLPTFRWHLLVTEINKLQGEK